jgi:hypothetical protein
LLRDLGESVSEWSRVLACLVGFETGKVVGCFAYLFIGVRMADVVARKVEGTALARRQNILRTLALFGGRLRWGGSFWSWRSSEAC